MSKRNLLQLVLSLAGMLGGLSLTFFSLAEIQEISFIPTHWSVTVAILAAGSVVGALIGFGLSPVATWVESRLAKAAFADIVFGSIGLITGLVIAVLIGLILNQFQWLGQLITVLLAVMFSYLGVSIGTRKRDEATSTISNFRRNRAERGTSDGPYRDGAPAGGQPKVLDTSVIIDGRIADIVRTGFLEGPLIIPSFVLEELRHIADSSDVLKRNRGRRGLDILNRIQKDLSAEVRIHEGEVGEGLEVDSRLLKLSRLLKGKVVTNDFNLNKVAELQGVPVLNINDLANAVKPAVLPGEEMTITVIKDGKEIGQGVAYLDDGTMIVVDGGKRYLGDTIDVTVTSVLQTAAGRMIFAKPKLHAERVAP